MVVLFCTLPCRRSRIRQVIVFYYLLYMRHTISSNMPENATKPWQQRLHNIVYEADTAAGKAFDVILLVLIVVSILVVMLDSVERWHQQYGFAFALVEWIITVLFTIEYILRLICIKKPMHYVTSFLGIIDLLAIVPSYLSVFFAGATSLLVFRSLRLLRVFRIFKLTHFISEMHFLGSAVRASLKKISIFMAIVVMLVIILGSVMYLVEGGQNGFSSIPQSIYWAIVTITTVGYGDISPVTSLGKLVASVIMLMGYGIIAVPTGIVTNEMVNATRNKRLHTAVCRVCGRESHDEDAVYCKYCGGKL